MARPLNTDKKDAAYAQALLARAKNKDEIRMAQAVLLPYRQSMPLAQAAELLGVSLRTLPRLRHRLRLKRQGKYAGERRGGRHRQNMSLGQEKRFLEQWQKRAAGGQIVVACEIRRALARKLGRPVDESYAYRLLARNNWRKLAPDTCHPKADAQKQGGWKKNSRKIWMPCSSPKKHKADPSI